MTSKVRGNQGSIAFIHQCCTTITRNRRRRRNSSRRRRNSSRRRRNSSRRIVIILGIYCSLDRHRDEAYNQYANIHTLILSLLYIVSEFVLSSIHVLHHMLACYSPH